MDSRTEPEPSAEPGSVSSPLPQILKTILSGTSSEKEMMGRGEGTLAERVSQVLWRQRRC